MTTLIIIRGLPGSGRDVLAKKLAKKGTVYLEADKFFITPDGSYTVDPNKIRYADGWCEKNTRLAIQRGDKVIVSNTFIKIQDVQPYIDMAKEENVSILILHKNSKTNNSLNVPVNIINEMRNGYEPIKGDIYA